MDVLEAIKSRRSIRQFTDEPLEKDVLERLLDAARWAPTASNQQRWRFVVVTDPSVKQLIRKFAPGIFLMPAAFHRHLCGERARCRSLGRGYISGRLCRRSAEHHAGCP